MSLNSYTRFTDSSKRGLVQEDTQCDEIDGTDDDSFFFVDLDTADGLDHVLYKLQQIYLRLKKFIKHIQMFILLMS